MGLNVEIFRGAKGHDFTLGGVSGRFDEVCVMNVEGPFEPTEDCPGVMLIEGPATNAGPNPILVPVELIDSGKWYMFGGNFGYTSDSRFKKALKAMAPGFTGAIKIHDRVEG